MPSLRLLIASLALPALPLAAADPPPVKPPPDLAEYVAKKDPAYAWEAKGKIETPAGDVFELKLVSQEWQGGKWTHAVQVFVPKGVKPTATVLLYNTGGSPSPATGFLGITLATKVGAPVAFVYHVPNQPLLGGKSEDALIAETFVRYLEKEDPTMPLLFPMVKSVTAAMDAVQAFAKKEWDFEVKQFVVAGASKRGWTSWLAAASGDPRVKAIVPMVIDNLNLRAQMEHQVKCFGKPSEMIKDYVERKLVPPPDTPAAMKLWAMVDPWVYREKLTCPKLIVNGTNDPYWAVDAMNLYWDDLKGDNRVLYVPNAGHGLEETDATGKKSRDRVVNTTAAFVKGQVFDKPLPKLTWAHANGRLDVKSDAVPKAARLWVAYSPTRDFRSAKWASTDSKVSAEGAVRAVVGIPSDEYAAFFVECDYELDGLAYTLSTQLHVVGKKP